LNYAKKHYGMTRFFRAENILDTLRRSSRADLLTLEDKIGEYSDCIIIVCESESAFAELGAFALSDKLVRQLLVVNDQRYRESQSFINLGPVARANLKSKFKPTIYADFRAILRSVVEIDERLKSIPGTYRKSVPLASVQEFRTATSKCRVLFLADLIHIFGPITPTELTLILKALYGDESFDVDLEVGLLRSLRFIERSKEDWLRCAPREPSFFYDYCGVECTMLRASIVRDYFQKDPARLRLLQPLPP
jgi:hypothetical protein